MIADTMRSFNLPSILMTIRTFRFKRIRDNNISARDNNSLAMAILFDVSTKVNGSEEHERSLILFLRNTKQESFFTHNDLFINVNKIRNVPIFLKAGANIRSFIQITIMSVALYKTRYVESEGITRISEGCNCS